MSTLIDEIIASAPDAKPLTQSLSARGILLLAVGWAAQNIIAWLHLDQSTETTIVVSLLGFVSSLGALIGVMRRSGIKVPDWMIDILESVEEKRST